jgi:tetratricopeptide (TPR) repeat protein
VRPPTPASDPVIAALVELAQAEFESRRYASAATLARLIRSRAPEEAVSQRLLSLIATAPDQAPATGAEHHIAMGKAYHLLGEGETAASHYRQALTFDGNLPEAHMGLAQLRMPGENYLALLERIYGLIAPESVMEIGVFRGESLALLKPPTVAIGIDPTPAVVCPLQTETHIFAETSDEFFAKGRAARLLNGRPLSVAFIDGLHLYEQVLRDFINVEMLCGPRSVILLHDTVPLDEPTQSRERDTVFHSGDVWKTVVTLKEYRPDLEIFTLPAAPTGLTVVTGLDSTSRVLADRYEQAVERFIQKPFSDIENALDETMNIVANDLDIVRARLGARGIL